MLLEIKKISGGYDGKDVVKDICCSIDQGEILCLVGPNGCGKTTFFRLLLGILEPSDGNIYVEGQNTKKLSAKELSKLIAYIPQYHNPVFSYTVLEVVIMGRASQFSALESPKEADKVAAFEALKKLKIEHLANKKYTSLSGGQRQLVLIARAICQSAKIFVMDEPTANLDYANQQLLMDVILDLAKNGYSVIMSTHSPEQPASIGSKVMMLREGKVMAYGKAEEVITTVNLQAVYDIEMDVMTVVDRYGVKRTLCLPVKFGEEKK